MIKKIVQAASPPALAKTARACPERSRRDGAPRVPERESKTSHKAWVTRLLERSYEFRMSSDKDREVNFVLVRTMKDRELVCLLLDRFPNIRDLVCPDEDCFELATIVYDSFARIVIQRSDDPGFIQSVVLFIDELAENKSSLVQEVLITCLLEGIAADEQVARLIERTMTSHSRSLLHEVESKFYGRTPSAEET
jgi:hypothetical protein